MERDLDAAVSWFEAIPLAATRRALAIKMSMGWPVEEAVKGLDFLIAHQDLFTTSSPWAIVEKNVVMSSRAGPGALSALLIRLGEERISTDFNLRTPMPDDFDYAAFVSTEGYQKNRDSPLLSSFLSNWLNQDTAAAASWLMDNGGPEALIRSTSGGFMTFGSEANDRLWKSLGAFAEELSPDEQSHFMKAAQSRLRNDPTAALNFAGALIDPELKDQAHELGAQIIARGEIERAVQHLDAIRNPARRLAFFESNPTSPFSQRKATSGERELLKSRLTAWGADDQQVEAILNSYAP
ncbi:hypothetical protein [Haloferula sargassicola]